MKRLSIWILALAFTAFGGIEAFAIDFVTMGT
jgi:hypothetical protein